MSEVLSGTSLFCFARGVGVAISARVEAAASSSWLSWRRLQLGLWQAGAQWAFCFPV